MRTVTIEELIEIGDNCADLPWGMGHKEFKGNSEIWAPYLRFLYIFTARFKPEAIVECGVYMATATEHMALADPGGLVIGIDRDFHNAAYNVVRRQNNVRFISGDTLDSFEHVELVIEGKDLELLFLDSTHDGETPSGEFDLYQPLMGEQCLVACDDILENQQMKDWWSNIEYPKVELHHLHPYPAPGGPDVGFGVFIYER
jgi:cephalosporin hydroxylase